MKTFILDTNVLIHDPEAIFKFKDNNIVLPIYVIEEIDTFKREASERGRNSRQVCRLLDEVRGDGNLSEGVPLGDNLGNLHVYVPEFHDDPIVPADNYGAQDRAILKTTIHLSATLEGPVVLVSMDTNLRIRAASHGVRAQNYENSRVKTDLQSSITEISVPGSVINSFFLEGCTPYDGLELVANSSVILRDEVEQSHTAICRYNQKGSSLKRLLVPREGVMGIRPKSAEQAFALDLLLDDSVSLVSLIGKAGTGKSLLAIAAGLHKTLQEGKYTRILVSRPIVPMGRDIGYLPGDMDEKLNPWMQPIFDNLEFIYGGRGGEYKELIESGIIQVEPLTFIRGRSLPNQFLILDEAQNMSPHEMKTFITRAGDGSKVVLTGDPGQIDNPYVDSSSNGLSVVADRFRGQQLAGSILLTKGERSLLAELASDLL